MNIKKVMQTRTATEVSLKLRHLRYPILRYTVLDFPLASSLQSLIFLWKWQTHLEIVAHETFNPESTKKKKKKLKKKRKNAYFIKIQRSFHCLKSGAHSGIHTFFSRKWENDSTQLIYPEKDKHEKP